MNRLIVLLLVTSLLATSVFAVNAVTQKKAETIGYVSPQPDKQVEGLSEKSTDSPEEKIQKQNDNAKEISVVQSSDMQPCVGPDGLTANASKNDCDAIWKFWNSQKSNNVNTTSNKASANNTLTAAETLAPTQTTTPTPEPTVQPTVVPTAVPTISPTPTLPPVKQNALFVSTFEIPSGGLGLNIITGLDGNLWFGVDRTGPNSYKYNENVLTNPIIGSIAMVTPDGEVTELYLPSSSNTPLNTAVGENMFHIAQGSDGNIWFTQPNANIIGNITPEGMLTEYQFTGQEVAPRAITTDSEGNIVFMDQQHGLIRMDTEGNILGNIPSVYGVTMTEGSDDTFWVGGHDVYKFAGDGSKSTFDISGRAVKIIKGANNDVWLSQNGGHLTNITNDGIISIYQTPQAWNVTMDANNRIWFRDSWSNKIYALDTAAGSISSYKLTTTEDYFMTRDLNYGPDGNLWFTANGTVGKIDISNLENVESTKVVPTIIQIPAGNPKMDKVTVLPCTSSSCGGITTIIVEGQNFASDSQLYMTGMIKNNLGNPLNSYNSSVNGQIVNRVGTSKITFDMQNLACDEYIVNIFSPSSGKSARAMILDLKPYTCK